MNFVEPNSTQSCDEESETYDLDQDVEMDSRGHSIDTEAASLGPSLSVQDPDVLEHGGGIAFFVQL